MNHSVYRVRLAAAHFLCALLAVLGGRLLEAQSEIPAKVKADSVAVHAKPSATSEVARRLKRDDELLIDFTITTSEGTWCGVKEEGQTASLGYVICAQLDYLSVKKPAYTSKAPASSSRGSRKTPTGKTSPEGKTSIPVEEYGRRLMNRGNPYFWAERLGFSEDQRGQVGKLLAETGMEACFQRLRNLFRSSGITGFYPLLMASENPVLERIETEAKDCTPTALEFWRGFIMLLNEDQVAQFKDESKTAPLNKIIRDSLITWPMTDQSQ